MRTVRLWVSMIVVAAVAVTAVASEGGGTAYPNGAEGWMTGALPPPGDYLIDYNLYYKADKLMGDDGSQIPIDFDLEVMGTVLRYVHVTEKQILGASWAQHIFVPFLNVDVSVPMAEDETFGIGDIIFDPIVLGWHKPPFHYATGVDVYLPAGSYDETALANVGRGYWTFQPVAACTYLDDNGIEVSAKAMYDINLENDHTDYKSGDAFHFDYAVGKHMKNWTVGLSGFYYTQVEEDEADGVDAANEGQQFAWGPMVAYQKGPLSIILKYQDESETENMPEGERVWLKFICPL